ncbi:MAG: helix-turn-helix transcriptional regulator [Hespellia sp.]|nr:helix-turn-helix transcriptional regulator [Hespellia sp.]
MKKEQTESLGTYVKNLRIEMNLTQAEVAAALNVTPGFISNVENNRTAMSLRVLTYYAKLTHVTLDALVGQMDPEYKDTALDNEVTRYVSKLDDDAKKKLIATLKIWLKDKK